MATPTFNFKLTAVVRKRKTRDSGSIPSGVKKVMGVIRIDLDAHYFVRVYKSLSEHQDYEISLNSMTCKGKDTVYKFEDGTRKFVQWTRTRQPFHELDYIWKPFKPGCIVKGYVNRFGTFEIIKIHHAGTEDFLTEDIINDNYVLYYNDVIAAQEFYRENIKEIQKNYKMRYGTTE